MECPSKEDQEGNIQWSKKEARDMSSGRNDKVERETENAAWLRSKSAAGKAVPTIRRGLIVRSGWNVKGGNVPQHSHCYGPIGRSRCSGQGIACLTFAKGRNQLGRSQMKRLPRQEHA
eukprot:scaffold44_cov339-Pavlova_lutheri.AAC.18